MSEDAYDGDKARLGAWRRGQVYESSPGIRERRETHDAFAGTSRGADAGCLYGLNTQHDPWRASSLAWRGARRSAQAARETFSTILMPSTATGGADGERWTGWPAAIAAATSASSNAVQLV